MTQVISVKPSLGFLNMRNRHSSLKRLAAISSAVAVGCMSPASAEEIRLMSSDRSVNISGQLLSFEDNTYRIEMSDVSAYGSK